ncbi:hypothetical protein [Ktedonospora formicarum]|nr:hypothetical protein [Ktedonospora formicarum]
MSKDANPQHTFLRIILLGLRFGWPVLILLGVLWFPFDWLSEVWPAFGVPFHEVFHNAHDHFVGHTIFFFIIGTLTLSLIPQLRRHLHWYVAGLILAALVQETIQAFFRGELPTFTDFNAFKGDALGGICARGLWFVLELLHSFWKRKSPITTPPRMKSS